MEKDKKDTGARRNNASPGAAPGDWVKELFAPIYDFDAIVEAGKHGYSSEGSYNVKRAPILEAQTVKEVFERVHQRVVESERLKQEEIRQRKEEEANKRIDPRKSSIWNTEELETLRKVYKSAKGEIRRLEIMLQESEAHKESLESALFEERGKVTDLTSKLSEAVKANQRLVVHRDELQRQAAVADVKVAALTDMWHEIDSLKLKAMEEAKTARQQLDSERLTRQKLELDLSSQHQNAQREKELAMQDLQTKLEMEINDLKDVVKDLGLDLMEEKRQHEAARRGLDHLRIHFASLPLKDVIPSGMVVEDQVTRIDHIGS